ncbi:MAG: hypothetical protein WC796_02360 [Candidatus Pacearchaeota archaeon]|jgi:hypothetical protein
MRLRNELLVVVFIALLMAVVFSSFVSVFAEDFVALQGNVLQNGINLDKGNLTVYVYDDYSAGNLVYNSSGDFVNAIVNGKYDVMLGNKTQKMNLEYGKKYFMEIYINTERLNFTNNSQRQIFQSSVGNVSSLYINWTTSINMPPGQNVSTGLGGWFKGLFNWAIGTNSQDYLSFNGSTLDLSDNVTRWLYNQTTAGGTFNVTYQGIVNNASYLTTYNSTYASYESTYNSSYVPYSGATGNVNLGYNNLTTNGSIALGIPTNIVSSTYGIKDPILLGNGTVYFINSLFSNGYINSNPGVLSFAIPNAFTTNIMENTSNTQSWVYNLYGKSNTGDNLNLSSVTSAGVYGEAGVSESSTIGNLVGVQGQVVADGNVSGLAIALKAEKSILGIVPNLYGLYIVDMSPAGVLSADGGIVTNGYSIYSAGGNAVFNNADNFNISNAGNTAKLCLNGVCYGTLASSSFNVTYNGIVNNASYLTTYNETYNLWTYNQTATSFYNVSYESTYNNTYNSYAYNQTIASGWNVSGTNLYTRGLEYNVGIGTITPSNKLEVNGTVNITNGNLYVNGSSEFGGGWQNGGVTVSEGKLFAQTGYFYNITSLTVNNLNVNASMIPGAGFDNQFDLGSSGLQWRNGYFGTDVIIAGNSVKQWMYNQTNAAGSTVYVPYTGATNNVNLGENNLTTNGITTIGQSYSFYFIPTIFQVNGSSYFSKNILSSDYFELIPGTASLGYGNYFTTNARQQSANPSSLIWNLWSKASAPGGLDLSGTQLVGTYSEGSVEAGTSINSVTGLQGNVDISGTATTAYSLYSSRTVEGNATNLYGLYIVDMSPAGVLSADGGIVTNGYSIYSAGGNAVFNNADNFNISNTGNTAKLCLNGNCVSSLAGSTYNATYNRWAYNMSDGSYNASYVPYTGSTGNVNLGTNNFTVGSNILFVNSFTGQVGIGTDFVNNTYLVRIAGNLLVDGNITLGGNISSLVVQGLSVNGTLLPGLDDTYDIGSSDFKWRNGYFSQEINVSNEVYVKNTAVSPWMYNQTTATNLSMYNAYNSNWLSTYNSTYNLYAYNQTVVSGWNLSSTTVYPRGLEYKVAIGTITPASMLTVNGNVSMAGNFFVNGNGRVGIGTAAINPTRLLDVRGDINVSSTIYIQNGTDINLWMYNQTIAANVSMYNAYNSGWISTYNASYITTYNTTYNLYAYNQTIASGWNLSGTNVYTGYDVGIGTKTPEADLTIRGAAPFISLNTTFDNSTYLIGNSNGNLFIKRNGTVETFRIVPNGDVGIGTSSPTQKLDVRGNINISNGVSDININPIGLIDSYGFPLQLNSLSTQNIYVGAGSGLVGIGTSSPATGAKLTVDGGNVVINAPNNLTVGGGSIQWDSVNSRMIIKVS